MIRRALTLGFAVALLAGCGGGSGPGGSLDNTLHLACPVTPGEIEIINGTPFVILAKACTRTPTPTPTPTVAAADSNPPTHLSG